MNPTIFMLVAFWISVILIGAYQAYISWMSKGKVANIIGIVLIYAAVLAIGTYIYLNVI